MTHFRQIGLPLAFVLLLTACTGETEPAPIISAPAAPVETPNAAPLEADTAPAPIIADLAQIRGATPADVLAYVGEPTLVRRDENVQVMTFETDRCVFEVIFYEPSPDDHFEARYINARDRSGRPLDTETCLSDVMIATATP